MCIVISRDALILKLVLTMIWSSFPTCIHESCLITASDTS